MLELSLNLVSFLVEHGCLLEHIVVETGLGESRNDPFLNFFLIVNEVVVAKSFEGALLDELFAGTVTHAESVHALVVVALARDKVDHLLDVPNRPICQKIDMR